MSRADLIWIKAMEWCAKYWGCHQMPERSFFAFGYQFPVCARCTGMILGEVTAIISILFFSPLLFACMIFMLPMIIDGIVQYKTSYRSTNIRRIFTGFLFGYGFISSILKAIYYIIESFIII